MQEEAGGDEDNYGEQWADFYSSHLPVIQTFVWNRFTETEGISDFPLSVEVASSYKASLEGLQEMMSKQYCNKRAAVGGLKGTRVRAPGMTSLYDLVRLSTEEAIRLSSIWEKDVYSGERMPAKRQRVSGDLEGADA